MFKEMWVTLREYVTLMQEATVHTNTLAPPSSIYSHILRRMEDLETEKAKKEKEKEKKNEKKAKTLPTSN